MEPIYKKNIVDFIEGSMPPAKFVAWFESTPEAVDWLQNLIPEGMTMDDRIQVTMEYFLKKLPDAQYGEIMTAYRALCEAEGAPIEAQIPTALRVVRLLSAVDSQKVKFDSMIPLLLANYDAVLRNPEAYKPDYVVYMVGGVRELFTETYGAIEIFPTMSAA